MSSPVFEGTGPLISDRFVVTMTAGEDLVAGVLVELTAAWTVKKPTAINSLKVVGITLTAASNGGKVSVVSRGICRAKAYAAIAAGDQLTSAQAGSAVNAGCVQTDNTSKNTSVIGLAVEAIASGGTGVIFLW
jgi:hypothetical protein